LTKHIDDYHMMLLDVVFFRSVLYKFHCECELEQQQKQKNNLIILLTWFYKQGCTTHGMWSVESQDAACRIPPKMC